MVSKNKDLLVFRTLVIQRVMDTLINKMIKEVIQMNVQKHAQYNLHLSVSSKQIVATNSLIFLVEDKCDVNR